MSLWITLSQPIQKRWVVARFAPKGMGIKPTNFGFFKNNPSPDIFCEFSVWENSQKTRFWAGFFRPKKLAQCSKFVLTSLFRYTAPCTPNFVEVTPQRRCTGVQTQKNPFSSQNLPFFANFAAGPQFTFGRRYLRRVIDLYGPTCAQNSTL